jgi:LPS export ABC transporter protein LptC
MSFVLIAIGIVRLETNAQEKEPSIADEKGLGESAPLTLVGVHLEEFEQQGKRMEIRASRALFFKDEQQISLTDVLIVWPSSKRGFGENFEIRGKQATYDLAAEMAYIREDVRLLSWDGRRIETNSVQYDEKRRRIEGEEAVFIEGPEGITEGVGLQVDLEKETFFIKENVRTLIRPSAFERAKEEMSE